ncbi:MAG: response regulator transcription factor [Thiothrix sp.]|uniref:LuxR C-terminal-related transcriptional regulator n=1 Tax=Thiothrix sp. TaxID=1032 RepID=UPI00262F4A42|nr:response regulator transcription factor [Thiothrix sp.]MDD5393291.1 response regulator transcription factor [Thiothrix sp.]
MPHILITDDHPQFLAGLMATLPLHIPDLCIHQALDIDAAKTLLKRHPSISLMLLDRIFSDSGVDSLQHLTELRETHPQLHITIMSGDHSVHRIWEAIDAGAIGFIPKNLSTDMLVAAIKRLLGGYIYLPRKLLENPYAQSHTINTPLSARHIGILSLASTGQSNKEIAKELNLTEGTIKQHFYAILKILDADNRRHAVQIARNRGFIC